MSISWILTNVKNREKVYGKMFVSFISSSENLYDKVRRILNYSYCKTKLTYIKQRISRKKI